MFKFLVLLLVALPVCGAYGQETVFDVPSADVLDKGKVYGELDGTVRPVDPAATFTPRVVVGIGHGVEVGVNFNGLSVPTLDSLDISPTVKWQLWKSPSSGWSFYAGDDLFFPVSQRTYDAGNYAYASFAKVWKHGTRIGLGGYDFTRNVVANGNRAGGQFTFEQPVNNHLTLAAEWYTGKHADGYVNPGAIIKLNRQITLYALIRSGTGA
ncbi:MAG: hypothetical protein WB952_16200 [Terriglobales bacterium]